MKKRDESEGVGGDPGRFRTTIKNTINTQDKTGRIVNKVEYLDLNKSVGHGCTVPADPVDPYGKKGKK